jgi:vancomycin resistance protein YoaR
VTRKKTCFILLMTMVVLLAAFLQPNLTLGFPKYPRFEAKSIQPFVPTMILTYEGKQWVFYLNEIGFDGIDPTTLNQERAMEWIARTLEHELNRPARSAYYRDRRVVPHQDGREVDREQIKEWLNHIHEVMGQPLEVPLNWIKPSLTTEKLQHLKEKRIGTYTTYYNHHNANRSHNIHLSVQAIDHKVLLPGEVFSFNRIVGPRSLGKGYRRARIIVKGEYSEGIGGGICQTSSTLYNSVDKAGLRIVERQTHSKHVSYVPRNRDATVSWGGPDFKFQNQLNEPILIVAKAKYGRLTISVYGPEEIQTVPRKVPTAPKETAQLEVEE